MMNKPDRTVFAVPQREITLLATIEPVTDPRNCAVKSLPACASFNVQFVASRGRIGPSMVVTTPVKANSMWIMARRRLKGSLAAPSGSGRSGKAGSQATGEITTGVWHTKGLPATGRQLCKFYALSAFAADLTFFSV